VNEYGVQFVTFRDGAYSSSVDESGSVPAKAGFDMELEWRPNEVGFSTNGVLTASSTGNIPAVELTVGWSTANWDLNHPSAVTVVDRVQVMRSVDPPPAYAFGPEQSAP